MRFKRIMILTIVLVTLLAVSAVSAAENATGDVVSVKSPLDDSVGVENQTGDSGENELIGIGQSPEILTADQGTYNDLRNDIGTGGNINLTKSYYRYNSSDGDNPIEITTSGIINGNGAVIDMEGSTIRAFTVSTSDVTIKNLTIKNVNFNGNGGAIYFSSSGTVINCNFTNNNATLGGAIYCEDNVNSAVINCNFTNNNATMGGAIRGGSATNCTFINNYAVEGNGGAIYYGSATNCTFINNYATLGGAIMEGSSINCTFINNYAGLGGAISGGSATNPTFILNYNGRENDNYFMTQISGKQTSIDSATIVVSDFVSTYNSGEKLLFDVVHNNEILKGVYIDIDIKNETFSTRFSVLSGEAVPIGLAPGLYEATLSNGHPNVQSKTVKLKITNGDTFYDLNRTINNNTDGVIVLDKNYTFNSIFDSEFINGIVIDRPVTIKGNGHTIDALQKARIFQVTASSINITGLTFKNGKADRGGAIYYLNPLSNSNINATFTNNTANSNGGANYFNALNNVTITGNFTNNTANSNGGANYFNYQLTNVAIRGDYTGNTAYNGGANYFTDKLNNVTISGDYTSNTATNYFGGANYFENTLTNVAITGDYTGNVVSFGGANYFCKELTNVNITGDYTGNEAYDGGANYFCKELTNVAIRGDYTNNEAFNGGANYFTDKLTNVTITGNYTGNKAIYHGGANHFCKELTNVNITGDYTGNEAYDGGANYFTVQLTNVAIRGDYTNNVAHDGGANYFCKELTNVAITGDYTGNKAYDGGANYFTDKLTNVTITGNYTDNTAGNNGGANYFCKELTNVNITGIYSNNSAKNGNGGANYFQNTLTNVVITGDYTGNTANVGGANFFNIYLINVVITGDYTGNTANVVGGANYFRNTLNVTITGDYYNNSAKDSGGANYFSEKLTNVTIFGDYTGNTATNGYGGANYFEYSSTNVTIFGDYIGNTATNGYGGANYFEYSSTNVIISGNYINNTAMYSGGANYFKKTLTNVIISGDYAYNLANGTDWEDGGGANHFNDLLTNVTITGDYAYNSALGYGGANYFHELTNVTITGNYTGNKATDHDGGANYFQNRLNNITINGDYTNNAANVGGGANYFNMYLINVIISGNYTNNTADAGGANYFNELTNVKITGNYTNNTAIAGGANLFSKLLTNVTITGDYTGNIATNGCGGANYFIDELNNVTITGDYTGNIATNGCGGANYFIDELNNVNITGDYNNNTAEYGGANYFTEITNVNITGDYTGNKATAHGGANYFSNEINYLNVHGVFINNSGLFVIYIDKSGENSVISDSIFLNNDAGNIYVKLGDIKLVNNWFGNNATNYNVTPKAGSVTPDNWLFLNATVDPVKFTSSTNVTFKLDSYDAKAKDVKGYNNSLIGPIELTLTSINATVKNSTRLNETVKYVPGDGEKGSVTATFENAQYTIELQNGKNPKLSVESETYNYNETISLALSYNPNATGNVSVTLNGKKHTYNYTNLALNVTVMLSGDILPDEYNVTVRYGGDVNFSSATANSTLTVKKANSTLKISDITFDYNATGSCEATFANATGITAEVMGHNEAIINVTDNLITVSGLDVGKYTLSVTTITDERYNNVTQTSLITVKPASSGIDVNGTEAYCGEDVVLNYTAVNAVNVSVSIVDFTGQPLAEGIDYNITITADKIIISDLKEGEYNVNVTTIVDANHASATKNVTVNVNPICDLEVVLAPANSTAYYGDIVTWNATIINHGPSWPSNVYLVAYAPEGLIFENSGYDNPNYYRLSIPFTLYPEIPLSVFLKTAVNATNTNLTLNVSVRDKYLPDSNPKSNNASASVEIVYANASVNVTADYEITAVDDLTVNVELPGDATGDVAVSVDGEKIAEVPLSGGSANITLPALGVGNHTVEITYSGDDKYTPVSETANVTVSKASVNLTASAKTFKDTDKTKKYTVTLNDSNGNPIANATVTLKVDGKTYTAKTNSNGVATFKLTKLTKKGTFTAVITYAGDEKYNNASAKAKIVVKSAWKTISKGSKYHSMVKKIQKALKLHGFYLSYNGRYLKVDGIYHIYTEKAVKQFQKANKLKVTGKVDEKTAKKLGII